MLLPEPVVEAELAEADGAADVLDALDALDVLVALVVSTATELLETEVVVDTTVLVLELVVLGVYCVELVVGS